MKHDTVSDFYQIVSCWLVFVFNIVNKSFKKSSAKSAKLDIELQKKKNRKKYPAQ